MAIFYSKIIKRYLLHLKSEWEEIKEGGEMPEIFSIMFRISQDQQI